MSSNDSNQRRMYRHKDKREMIAFISGYLRSAAQRYKDNKNVLRAYQNKNVADYPGADAGARTEAKKAAEEDLYGILVGMIDNDDLVTYLATNHLDKGYECISYIQSCFSHGDDDSKLSDANNNYLRIQTKVRLCSGAPLEARGGDERGTNGRVTGV